MAIFSELHQRVDRLARVLGEELEGVALPSQVAATGDAALLDVLSEASALINVAETVRIAAAGVLARRSTRELGHSGLAQVQGHRTPVSLVQQITGATRGDAAKQVRLGEALLAGAAPAPPEGEPTDAEVLVPGAAPARPWHHPLSDALLEGLLTHAQHDAILRGLGEPPIESPAEEDGSAFLDAWQAAAEQLLHEASGYTVEDLNRAARTLRDVMDPEGAARRFDQRYEARSFRMWRDGDGIHRASISFDDENAAWVQSIIAAGMRPRRGGPRFVDPDEAAKAQELIDDPRTNDQLTYDLIMSTLRAGAVADAERVFGTRQAGVRLVITRQTPEGSPRDGGVLQGVGFVEDGGEPLPAAVIERISCATGQLPCTLDEGGNPLDLGREQRLFSARQRIALALRDGGCRWGDCTMPASYCESHHIDHWREHYGRTDIDRGILLCAFHHLHLHGKGWRITRDRKSDFLLHPPPDVGDRPVVLRSKSPLHFLRLAQAIAPSRSGAGLSTAATATRSSSPRFVPNST